MVFSKIIIIKKTFTLHRKKLHTKRLIALKIQMRYLVLFKFGLFCYSTLLFHNFVGIELNSRDSWL